MGVQMDIGTKVWSAHDPYTSQAVKTSEGKTEGTKDKAEDTALKEGSVAARFDRSTGVFNKRSAYEINSMSKEDRAAIIEEMKRAESEREQSLTDMVQKMLRGQADTFNKATGISFSGTVSQEAIRKAKEDISEDGYYGVKQTSQRLFDFASALAGDDVEKMRKMQSAMNKGIGQAARALGGHLPSISRDTQDAANQLFKDYYKSKGVSEE